mmetsp:Transcript_10788/g.31942  ORF Transcript_10788/g.31942 Transcript_10788/m.31942 type:complete len:229 (-) Transcript_10788:888-1574(-)
MGGYVFLHRLRPAAGLSHGGHAQHRADLVHLLFTGLRGHDLLPRREQAGADADRAHDHQAEPNQEQPARGHGHRRRGAPEGAGQQREHAEAPRPPRRGRRRFDGGEVDVPADGHGEAPEVDADRDVRHAEQGAEARSGAHGDGGPRENDHQDRLAARPGVRRGRRRDHRPQHAGRRQRGAERHDPRAARGGHLRFLRHPEFHRRDRGPAGPGHGLRQPDRERGAFLRP